MAEKEQKSNVRPIFAEDIMTENAQVVNKNTTIVEVAHLMLRIGVSAYPIVDDTGDVIGIVTLTDLFKLLNNIVEEEMSEDHLTPEERREIFHKNVSKFRDKPISDIMSDNVVFVKPDTELNEIVEAVAKLSVHTFPVMQGKHLVGIIGRHDMLNATFSFG
ncbi:MAG: CBS domain-containing protein [Candidatus Zapsychrus exili]|nr:CBS domain-containing protein [Candidatus Zapsychrus exili]